MLERGALVSRRCARAIAGLGLLATACCGTLSRAQSIPGSQDYEQIERGRYLVIAADCQACHTDDPAQPLAGGRPIETPFGTVVSRNITPDADTGIGNWSDEQFDAALRQGVMPDGKRLYPAMPYTYYARMTRSDVLAMRAYLNTIAPVHNVVHSDTLPFPFNIRAVMQVWDALYFSPGVFKPDPARSEEWNRGAYLVIGPGHCGACHTPKTLMGGDKSREALKGYNIQDWFAPDITNDATAGVGRWEVEDIVAYLKTGHNRYSAASGPMGEEVEDSSSQWSSSDLNAVAIYLKGLGGAPGSGSGSAQAAGPTQGAAAASGTTAPMPGAVQAPPSGSALSPTDARMVAGAAIYSDLCSACHAPDGSGVAYMIPSLAGSPNVVQHDPTSLIRVVINGARSVATPEEPTDAMMPTYGWQLDDEQIAAVLTYIRNSWGHAAAPVSTDDVHHQRESLRPGAND
jgi:mono/diheme cytochrome c family protein